MLAGSWVKTRLALLDNILESTAYLEQWKFDYEKYYDDAFARVFGTGRNDGRVGAVGGPNILIMPPHPASGSHKITQTVKQPHGTWCTGVGTYQWPNPGTSFDGSDMVNTDPDTDMDMWHITGTGQAHGTRLTDVEFRNGPRHGWSSHNAGFGEQATLDRVQCTLNGGDGIHFEEAVGGNSIPLVIGTVSGFGNVGAAVRIANEMRTVCNIRHISADDCASALKIDIGAGHRETHVHVGTIKAEVKLNNVMESIIDLENGNNSTIHFGLIHVLVIAGVTHTGTYRVIKNTVAAPNPWRVSYDRVVVRPSSQWTNEIQYQDTIDSYTVGDLQFMGPFRGVNDFVNPEILGTNANKRISVKGEMGVYYYFQSPEGQIEAPRGSFCLRNGGSENGQPSYKTTDIGSNTGWINLATENRTTAQLEDISDAINTTGKYIGKEVFNTTTGRPVYALGTSAGSVWNFANGTTGHTPI